ncbi:sugar-binding transcriptional regulator [Natronincola ferrireducens]|uniref:DNA-binding transcriptional regulator LsrR, DeoR family n=1 Tax=Natronincola ferrireducens TaxID=393762 RepID=A0A1G9J613_9FIRM|nr:sugar-binding transcriptional regulator [Natronincola ferrireducens]SDL32949.1 DNA-binding transcriptional regulator LsrR, DeoR family [Natronincola ferrireducens]
MINDNVLENPRLDYIRIANYYYKAGLTQEEIAKNMNMSRQRVNRMLSKCLELGIVKISIEGVDDTYLGLETELEKKYNLKAVRISGNVSEENVYEEIGKVGAQYLTGLIGKGDVIGFSRGRSISALVEHMPVNEISNITVTQLMGGWNNQQTKIEVDDIVRRFSEKINATPIALYAPVVVNNPEFRKAIMNEPFFCEAYRVIKSCSIAVVGIGDATYKDNSSDIKGKYYEYYECCANKNAVGEICARFFDINGQPVKTSLDEHVITVELKDFLKIPMRIGVAGLQSKTSAILGALRGGYINSLITDFDTAQILLNQKDK